MKRSSSEGRQQGRSIARATRGLLGNAASRRREGGRVRTGNRPSLDARSLAQPCYLPKENHRPQREKNKKEIKGQRHPSSHDVPDWGETKRRERMKGQTVSRARRAPTMKQWLLDARSSRQSYPSPKDQAGYLYE